MIPIRHEMIIDERAANDDGTYTITVAATPDIGDGKPLNMGEVNFDRYLNNPVVFWGHDRRDLPIARTTEMSIDGETLEAKFEFLEGDPKAERVKNAWDRGFINGASIGVSKAKDLVEWSLVGIPADPAALRRSMEAALDDILQEEPSSGETERSMTDQATISQPPTSGEWRAAVREDVRTVMREELAGVIREMSESNATTEAGERPQANEKRTDSNQTEADSEERTPQERRSLNEEVAAEEVIQRATDRAELIVRAQPFLPGDYNPHAHTDEEILRQALGDAAAEDTSVEFMRGQLSVLSVNRQDAQTKREQLATTAKSPVEIKRDAATDAFRVQESIVSVERDEVYAEYLRSFEEEED